jgi:hypothetical protein
VLRRGRRRPPIKLRRHATITHIGYFQSGARPGETAFEDINCRYRKDLTIRFRDAMSWPHVRK